MDGGSVGRATSICTSTYCVTLINMSQSVACAAAVKLLK